MFYEPPLINVISFACNACEETSYTVTDLCRSCIAHPCTAVCPVKAVSIVNGRSYIDKSKCVKCGRCAQACPYSAIVKSERPCAAACGVDAIESDEYGRAKINYDKCVSCGQCLVSCPFSAIADKSQIFQLIQAMKKGDEVIVELAPAVIGQFGTDVRLWKIKAALKEIGFAEVYEVALGADIGAITEAKHYVHEVATGKLPFLLTSCCPAWSVLAKRTLPEEMVESVSSALTPMVATARSIKQKHPNSSRLLSI
nr:[Fe-Fe] hydrogenase large subunit C-terminal domain-containing protein [uncultured Parabacteroides sp.]